MHAKDADKLSDDQHKSPTRVMVANGQCIQAEQSKQMDIGVEGKRLTDAEIIQRVLLRLLDPVVTYKIHTNAIS